MDINNLDVGGSQPWHTAERSLLLLTDLPRPPHNRTIRLPAARDLVNWGDTLRYIGGAPRCKRGRPIGIIHCRAILCSSLRLYRRFKRSRIVPESNSGCRVRDKRGSGNSITVNKTLL